uniref:Uncharacterized protein n=1 Tax=Schlesneria paludicola TaxID=360056 RepID=A0A7C2NYL4_9PLAN
MSRFWLLAVGFGAGLGTGCGQQDAITQYTIPKHEAIQLPAVKPSDTASKAPRAERMLGAIIPHGSQTWFFKLSGDPQRVASREEPFRDFVKSIRFAADDTPTWTLPAGWTQQPESGMRFATVIVDAEKPLLELTVIALPTAASDPQEQVLANVNRWRGQLSLPPIELSALSHETETLPLSNGDVATLVNYIGTTKPGGGMTPPFASALNRPFAPSPGKADPTGESSFTAQTPDGWSTGKVGGMRKAAFVVEDEERGQRAEVTVIDLSRDAGDRLANVNRWRGQIGLEPINEAQLQSSMERIDIAGESGDFVELTGSNGDSILGVIIDRGDKTWFFKLQGPTAIATAQKANFLAYVRSVKWK